MEVSTKRRSYMPNSAWDNQRDLKDETSSVLSPKDEKRVFINKKLTSIYLKNESPV